MSLMCQTLREEFCTRHFLFSGVHPGRFYNFQYRLPPFVFLVYRLCLAIYVDFWLLYFSAIHFTETTRVKNKPEPWLCYLTVWTYNILAVYLTIHAVIVLVHYLLNPSELLPTPSIAYHTRLFHELSSIDYHHLGYEQIEDDHNERETLSLGNRLPWYLKLVWILQNVVSVAAVIVTSVFFLFLMPHMKGVSAVSLENVQLHMLNTVIIVIENVVCAAPHRLLHVVYPALYGLVYVVFSVVYWAPDHAHVMYPNVLNWNQPVHTVEMICIIAFVFLPLIQVLYHIIYRLKMCILRYILTC